MGAQLILTLGVSFILFHGGLQLSLTILSKVAIGLLMLVIPGVVLTALLTGGVAAAVFGVPLTTGLLIGAALSPTDPAILIPLFERMRLRAKVSQTIIAESALNDPTGAVLALAFAGVVLSGSASLTTPMTDFLVDLALSTALGIVFGIVLSAVVSSRRTGIWRESAAIVVIAVVAGSFFSIDSAGGSGYLGAFLAGLILGNMPLLGLGMHTPSRGRDARIRLDGVALDGDARLHHARGEPAVATRWPTISGRLSQSSRRSSSSHGRSSSSRACSSTGAARGRGRSSSSSPGPARRGLFRPRLLGSLSACTCPTPTSSSRRSHSRSSSRSDFSRRRSAGSPAGWGSSKAT